MLREFTEQMENLVFEGVGRTTSFLQEHQQLSGDLLESDEAYLVVFDAPGVTSEDIDVRFTDNTVQLRIEREPETYGAEGKSEREQATAGDGSKREHSDREDDQSKSIMEDETYEMRLAGRGRSLSGSVSLPTDAVVETEQASANLTEVGTLHVTLPKSESNSDEPIRIDTAPDEDENPEE